MNENRENRVTVRDATVGDAKRLAEIYSYYVTETAVSFEYTAPTAEEFALRINRIKQRYPYLVIEEDSVIVGYAYAGAFVGRAAYEWACELTIYLDVNAHRKGYGKMLYTSLEERLAAMGILNLYACIAVTDAEDEHLNGDSPLFHAHMGFRTVGTFRKCGYKFGRWYDMIWAEKIIGEHGINQKPVVFANAEKKEEKK